MKVPHPIPYQGSKRNLAKYILPFIPTGINQLVEPFAGSAALSIAAAINNKANKYWLNDFNAPLIELLKKMVLEPNKVSDRYSTIWHDQLENSKEHFSIVREIFNETHEPELLLYLLARCVKNAVRYNEKGEFNQSADNRRKGRSPEKMKKEIEIFSSLMKDKTIFSSVDYSEVLNNVGINDWVYMDPPYMGTTGSSKRYIQGLDLDKFIYNLKLLNNKNIPFIISFDGRTGEKEYGEELPSFLELYRLEINAGKSSQATLQGKSEETLESLYLSKEAIKRSPISREELLSIERSSFNNQLALQLNW
ncbi:DNA adenine methylase [Halalkalibacterium halodurans]|uniref:Dam family site-specific DNA-(adenine-N6)-methyltransferase n=1 Tax=Halalkalibacterium halodurans TaxID=86665 RepID=UPI0010687E1A|nr:Dam family site-specific DNA-(adenine-N6)-methyltransferase [Halalkalibacterium halodurans]TES48759.1 DNA adenine methylase [Halalkalibacterium halodurans]